MSNGNDNDFGVTKMVISYGVRKGVVGLIGWISLPVVFGMILFAGIAMAFIGSTGNAEGAFCGRTLPGEVNTQGVQIAEKQITSEQALHAEIVIETAKARGLSARDAKIGLMTSLQESKLVNHTGGDRDSAGIFQQRPSQGWGTYEQVTDPVFATNTFFDRLVQIEDRDSMPLMEVAIAVQRPSRAAYTSPSNNFNDWEDEANMLLGGGASTDDTGFTVCGDTLSAEGDLRDPGPGPPGANSMVPRAENLRNFVFDNWGCDKLGESPCIKEIGGYRATPSGPQDHSLGLALDIVISLGIGQYPNADEEAFGWGMACFFQQNAEALGIQYAIWQGKIWNVTRNSEGGAGGCSGVGNGWRDYSGSGVTQGHHDHIHVTVQPGPP